MIFKSAKISTEHKYVISDSSSQSSSDSDTLDFGMKVEGKVGESDSQISSERSMHMPTNFWLAKYG